MAGDDTPNIMWWWGMDNDFLQWKNASKLVDVSEYMKVHQHPHYYNNKMDP